MTSTAVPPDEASSSARKRRAILDTARAVFLEKGFGGTGMDEVAARADVSKVTIYRYFSDKDSLFIAAVTATIDETELDTRLLVDNLGASVHLERDFTLFARRHIADVTAPDLLRTRRMIIAEAQRFPELAAAWHRAGPERAHASLATQLVRLADRGLLDVPDPLLAAQHLNYLILSVPLNEAMFTARDRPYRRRELNRWADEAVRVFLAGYAPARSPEQE